ncbi:MAG TPA: SDR family oxidoreductase [Gammaproteobacteria bacterium]|nr:SDR family oxidoreductase [Gammaproteobacteria bacterium]
MNRKSMELEGQVALVTGSAKNIGRAINLALADAGAKVVINALNSAEEARALADEIEAGGREAMAHVADIRDPDEVAAMMKAVGERFGGLNILVNNASLRQLQPLEEMTLERWREIYAVTVEGAMLCVVAALPYLRECGNGTVINISGIASQVGVKDRLHAASANAALEGMARSLAHELAPFGVTANAISPGFIDTVRGATAGKAPASIAATGNLLRRKGRPEEIAAMVRALCGPAGRYITGQTICVNGGMYLT